MDRRTFEIIYILVVFIVVISSFFYQRFNIADEYIKIIKIIAAIVVVGMGVRLLLYTL